MLVLAIVGFILHDRYTPPPEQLHPIETNSQHEARELGNAPPRGRACLGIRPGTCQESTDRCRAPI
jgi:hypothetical protein